MRLWSIHPQYLDGRGLVSVWREALLAQKVLQGGTKGYRYHPQLKRFREHPRPLNAIACYLMEIWEEGRRRGYHFNKEKIGEACIIETQKVPVSRGQLKYELNWLCGKLERRDPERYQQLLAVFVIECHPSFLAVDGDVEEWEKVRDGSAG